jgi:DNA polymerase-3 subunit alpha
LALGAWRVKFVSLHHHTTFSYRDGFGMPEAHITRTADLGMRAQAVTEHGNTSSHVKHEKAANAHGIKPLYGCELYTAAGQTQAKWHLTALAATQDGYQNLNRLVSRSWAEGFYYWPTVSGEMLRDHAEGLIVLSGCSDSLLNCTLLGGKANGPKRETASSWDIDAAEQVVWKFKELFGDGYYLETQQFPELARTRALNPILAELSRRTGVRLVATADVHYPMPEDNEMQKILHAAGRGSGSVEAQEATWEYDIKLTLPTSDVQVHRALMGTGLTAIEAAQALHSTGEIADRCTVILPRNERIRWPLQEGYSSSKDLVWEWLRDGWRYRWAENFSLQSRKTEYYDRLQYEMHLVESKDFLDYFLMLSYLVRWAKGRGIVVGPARGSAASSLVCYLLRITEIDPLQFKTMMFERFIDATREDLPDVDLDFQDNRRHEVFDEAARVFGRDHVGQLGNFVRYRGRNSVNDVARVYRVPRYAAKAVNDLLIDRSQGDSRLESSLEDTVETFPAAAQVFEQFPDLRYAFRLEGNMQSFGVHAAGIVISNDPITDTCAIYEREVGKEKHRVSVVAYDKKDAEYLGMLKADFLGLSNCGMLGRALELTGMPLEELYRIPLNDEKTMQGFRNNDVIGVFQFEGRATRLVCREVVPDNFDELADINALSRPGPLFSGVKTRYVGVKHGTEKVEHLHPIVDKHTEHTKFQIVYQEQVLAVIRDIGGFPVTKVADIRKIISQKLGEAQFNNMLDAFTEGALRLHGINHELAVRIWKFMVTSATYSFNIAHSVSYSMLSYWNMWFKQHHPLAFYSASAEWIGRIGKWKEKGPRLLRDAQRKGIRILPPDPGLSSARWTPVLPAKGSKGLGGIRAGFEQVPGVGERTASAMLAYRAHLLRIDHKYGATAHTGVRWEDFVAVRGIGDKTINKIRAFAEDDDPFGLDLVGKVLRECREGLRTQTGFWRGLPKPTHTSEEMLSAPDGARVVWIGVAKAVEYKDLIEDQRARFGTSTEEILANTKDSHLRKWATIHAYDDGDEEVYLRFNRYNFPKFKAGLETLRPDADVLLIIGEKNRGFGNSLKVKKMMAIDPEDDDNDDE